ncbi:MAG TPA: hypothetical protein VGR15_07085, partial [Bacteroidota bacterium]|nr:hypothetical protein [Bacteroidota bacterium]
YYFESIDSTETEVLGSDRLDHPNFIKIPLGEGAIYIHLVPWIFTNYNILKADNASFASELLTQLPQGELIWDEYYKGIRHAFHTPLSFVLQNDALRWAYYTMVVGVFAFIFVEGKRRQRNIPIFVPLRNETLSFVGTLARLYYYHRHHKRVALQMRLHILEFIRTKYRLATGKLDDHFAEVVSRKAGIPEVEVKLLVNELRVLDVPGDFEEKQLMRLNERMERFYGRCR